MDVISATYVGVFLFVLLINSTWSTTWNYLHLVDHTWNYLHLVDNVELTPCCRYVVNRQSHTVETVTSQEIVLLSVGGGDCGGGKCDTGGSMEM